MSDDTLWRIAEALSVTACISMMVIAALDTAHIWTAPVWVSLIAIALGMLGCVVLIGASLGGLILGRGTDSKWTRK